jgi:hypothetical protein
MVAGGKFINANGSPTIDGKYKNLGLRVKQQFNIGSGGVYSVTVLNGFAPVLFINCSGYAGLIKVDQSGTTYTFYIKAASSGVCTAYIFDVPVPVVSQYGMLVNDASGVCIFNTENEYLRIVDFFGVYGSPNYPGYFPNVNRSYASGDYAVAIGAPRTNSQGGGVYLCDGINTTNNSITVSSNVSLSASEFNNSTGYTAQRDGFTTYALTANVTGY